MSLNTKKAIYCLGSAPLAFIPAPVDPRFWSSHLPNCWTIIKKVDWLLGDILSRFAKKKPVINAGSSSTGSSSSRVYRSFSAVDIKVSFQKGQGYPYKVGTIHTLSYEESRFPHWFPDNPTDFFVKGYVKLVVFDQTLCPDILKDEHTIWLRAENEYGAIARMKIEGVQFITGKYSVDIDDIITDELVEFRAKSCSGWMPLVVEEEEEG